MMIFNKLIILALVLFPTTYVQAQCLTGNCGVVYSDVIYSSPSVVYSSPSPSIVYSSPSVVYEEPLHLYLKNVSGGERTRQYANVYVEEDKYRCKIPVINGILPSVTLYRRNNDKVTDIVLDYGSNRKYSSNYISSDGYIHYNSNDKKVVPSALKLEGPINARKNDVPSAVKLEEVPSKAIAPETILPIPKNGLIRPSDSEVDEIFNQKSRDEIFNQKSRIETSIPESFQNDEIDSLLRKPSSVMDGNSTFPNYNR